PVTMADQIVVMHAGIVGRYGNPLHIYDHPANLFGAGSAGSPAMDFIPGTLRRHPARANVEFADGSSLPAPQSAHGAGADGQKVIYGVRPEHLSISEPDTGLKSIVVVVEPRSEEHTSE